MRQATALLEEAGWRAEGGVLRNAAGEPFVFEILVQSGQVTLSSGNVEAIANLYVDALRQLGIDGAGASWSTRRSSPSGATSTTTT